MYYISDIGADQRGVRPNSDRLASRQPEIKSDRKQNSRRGRRFPSPRPLWEGDDMTPHSTLSIISVPETADKCSVMANGL